MNRLLARAATLELGARRWRRLPDSHSVLYGRLFWVRVGHRLVSPWLGDGSPHYQWGRPLGGILDPEKGIWSDLPDPPERSKYEFGTGVVTRTRGHYSFPTASYSTPRATAGSCCPRSRPDGASR